MMLFHQIFSFLISLIMLGYCFHPWCPDGRSGGQQEEVCPDCISETVRCRKLILGSDIG